MNETGAPQPNLEEVAAAEAETVEEQAEDAAGGAEDAVVVVDDPDTTTSESEEASVADDQQTEQDVQPETPVESADSASNKPVKEQNYPTFELFSADAIASLSTSNEIVAALAAGAEITSKLSGQVDAQLQQLQALLRTEFSHQDEQELYPQLLEMQSQLRKIKVDELISSLPETISPENLDSTTLEEQINEVAEKLTGALELEKGEIFDLILGRLHGTELEGVAQTLEDERIGDDNPDRLDAALEELENNESDSTKKEEIKKTRKFMKVIGFAGVVLGETLHTFFDARDLDLAAFISFIMNPTGSLASGIDYRRSGENGKDVVSHHVFKEKFKNFKDVGASLGVATNNLSSESDVFKSWHSKHDSELSALRDSADSVTTHSLFVSLDSDILGENVMQNEENWQKFSLAFASALFGGDVELDADSISFLKEKMKNGGEGLKSFWNIGEGSNLESVDNSKESATEEATDQADDQLSDVN